MSVASNRSGLRLTLSSVSVAFSLLAAFVAHAQPPASAKAASTRPAPGSGRVALYAAVGAELTQYEVDVGGATLVKRGSVTLPGKVQYAWPHPSKQYLYVAWSDGGPRGPSGPPVGGRNHGVSAFRIDAPSGALHPQGRPISLPSRPVHLSTDISGEHVLVAHNDPSAMTVYRIGSDGSIAAQVKEPAALDAGIYAHQVRVDPSNRTVILVTRGNGPTRDKPEDPGALKIFSYKDGLLSNRASVAPGGGFNFQPRHLDFHPSRPWVFVSLERQNQLQVYKKLNDGTLSAAPLFTKDSLADPAHVRPGQAAGTVHVHPNGRFVYQANRASGTVDFEGKAVFAGGENTIAVFAINPNTAEPTLIQKIDTQGVSARTFALDPSARILVAGNQVPFLVRRGPNVATVPASLAVYRVRDDGKLDFVRKYDVEASGSKSLFWMGLVALP
jgi:6-phosphogluconolactonase (cycloisomerase 2 family)